MKFIEVESDTPLINSVVSLADKNKSTLGLFPRGAFQDHAHKGNIVAALSEREELLGYILFRVVRGSEVGAIVHLCISHEARGAGVARNLLNHLRFKLPYVRGFRLRCRNDYPAHTLWPHLGFVSTREIPGRGKKPLPLTVWWWDFGKPTIFDEPHPVPPPTSNSLRVVIDVNIYFDLLGDSKSRPQGEDTRALLADWVTDVVQLEWLITPELKREVHERAEAPSIAFAEVNSIPETFDRVLPEVLHVLYGTTDLEGLASRDVSDARQIAHALAAGETLYVTRDESVLRVADSMRERFHLEILQPVELICRLDQLQDQQKYRPVLLRDLALTDVTPTYDHLVSLGNRFLRPGEKKSEWLGRIRNLLASPATNSLSLVKDGERSIALIGCEKVSARSFRVTLFRAVRDLASRETILRHLLWRCVEGCVLASATGIECVDWDHNDQPVLESCDFQNIGQKWVRIQVPGVIHMAGAEAHLRQIASLLGGECGALLVEFADRFNPTLGKSTAAELERLLWPVLISGASIPSVTIPIRPQWAKELFDYHLARGYLDKPVSQVLLNTENVYYTAAPLASSIRNGTRILWYVSNDSFQLRALSRCIEVQCGTAKELFRQFSHLGIYTWPQVRDLQRGKRTIWAIRFSHTRLFPRPVSLADYNLLCQKHMARKVSLQSPALIAEETLRDVVALGAQ